MIITQIQSLSLYVVWTCPRALTIDHKKGVLKTAKGLLRIQRAHKTMAADNAWHVDFSRKGENGNKTQ